MLQIVLNLFFQPGQVLKSFSNCHHRTNNQKQASDPKHIDVGENNGLHYNKLTLVIFFFSNLNIYFTIFGINFPEGNFKSQFINKNLFRKNYFVLDYKQRNDLVLFIININD